MFTLKSRQILPLHSLPYPPSSPPYYGYIAFARIFMLDCGGGHHLITDERVRKCHIIFFTPSLSSSLAYSSISPPLYDPLLSASQLSTLLPFSPSPTYSLLVSYLRSALQSSNIQCHHIMPLKRETNKY